MKNKKIANIVLGSLSLIFLILLCLKHIYGELYFIRIMIFTVEAALAGSVADWFAVTVLFERPLGLPIQPLIPANRKRILRNISQIINENLLDIHFIRETVQNSKIKEWLIKTADDEEIRRKVLNSICDKVMEFLREFKGEQELSVAIEKYVKLKVKDMSSFEEALNLADRFLDQQTFESVLYYVMESITKDSTSDKIQTLLKNKIDAECDTSAKKQLRSIAELTNVLNYDDLTSVIQEQCITYINEIRTNYPEVKGVIINYIENSSYLKNAYIQVKNEFIDELSLQDTIAKFIGLARQTLITDIFVKNEETGAYTISSETYKPLLEMLSGIISGIWSDMKTNESLIIWIESMIKETLINIIEEKKFEFTGFIEERMNSLSDEELSSLIQNNSGNVLQWIRLNGAMLGAMLGFAIFILLNGIYVPYIVPMIHKIVG